MKSRLLTCLPLLGMLCYLHAVKGQNNYQPNECTPATDSCAVCIQKGPTCTWCKDKTFQVGESYPPRCDYRENHLKRGCKNVSNPQSTYSFMGNKTTSKRVFPNNITVNLRPGVPTKVKLSVITPENYPVDLYYLMDLSASMGDDKQKILDLGNQLAEKMKNVTSNFRLGFGAFVDKPLGPYTYTDPGEIKKKITVDGYQRTFGFTNYLPLDKQPTKFRDAVDKAKISYNIDEPEGSLDALMQVVACDQAIRWRPKTEARRIVILTTDATFHYAGDGLLGGVVTPNDGKCHLTNGSYDASTRYDYPSLSFLRSKMSQAEILPIFATTGNNELYKKVADFFGAGAVADKLAGDSSNIVPLISKAYAQIAKYVKVETEKVNGLDTKVNRNCGSGAKDTDKPYECSNVNIGEEVEFTVSLTAKSCSPELKKKKTFKIKTTFEDVEVNLNLICGCQCEKPDEKITNSSICNDKGDQVCGKCVCNKPYSGRFCQCDAKTNNKTLCRRTPGEEVCSGRGECDCGECVTCIQTDRKFEQIYGKYCECSNATCGRSFGLICGGPTRGKCLCNKCECNENWTGSTCGEKCINSTAGCLKDGKICNGIGKCKCGKCTQCTRRYTGDFCEQCIENCPDPCVDYRECVRCSVFQTSNLKGKECQDECRRRNITKITKVDSVDQGAGERCVSSDKDDCSFVFTYRKDNVTKEIELLVRRERICPAEPDILAIILGVIAGIVGVGLALLLIWKLLATIQDRREFAKFEKDRQNAKWDTGENPIFKQATSTFKNPLYGGGDVQS